MPQIPSAAGYGAQLQGLIRALRADTGKTVPFATVTMRLQPLGVPAPHNVIVVNAAMRAAAQALSQVHVIEGGTPWFTRYFDEERHCASLAEQQQLGILWVMPTETGPTRIFATPCACASPGSCNPEKLLGDCTSSEKVYRVRNQIAGCMPHDLHFTARGAMRLGGECAQVFLGEASTAQRDDNATADRER